MKKSKFSNNELKIVSLLENVNSFISIKDLAEKVNISERSVYKYLSSINRKLNLLGIEGIRNVYGHGYYLGDYTKLQIKKEYFSQGKINSTKFTSVQRKYLDYLELFINGKLSLSTIIKTQKITKSTALKDIKDLNKYLKQFNLAILSSKDGHVLFGNERSIREYMFSQLSSNHQLLGLYNTAEFTEL